MSKGFSIVVAMDKNRGIGKDGTLPWKLSGDMKFFKELTTCPDSAAVEKRWGLKAEASGAVSSWEDVKANLRFAHKLPEASSANRNGVLMGRKTWESLPETYQPLPNRFNAVLSRRASGTPKLIDVVWFSFETGLDALDNSEDWYGVKKVFVIGGGQVFGIALPHPDCAHLYITEIDSEFPCDTFFPAFTGFTPALSSPWIEENGIRYRFRRYDRT